MEIKKLQNDKELIISLEGELNTVTAPQLEEVISSSLKGITSLIFDFKGLNYLSSAGLRVLLVASKIMNKQGKMVIRNVNEQIIEIFEMTGFINILDVEN